jgi:GNAT superfamily N-acetyltransferase
MTEQFSYSRKKPTPRQVKERELGVPVPKFLVPRIAGGFLVTTRTSLQREVTFGRRLAELLWIESKHDFALWPRRKYPIKPDPERMLMIAAIRDGRAVGFLITTVVSDWFEVHLGTREHFYPKVKTRRAAAYGVWTAHQYRRQGIAVELVEMAALVHKIDPREMAWVKPISDLGMSLVKRFTHDGKAYIY